MKLFALLVLVVTISLTIAVPQRRRGGTRERSSDDGSRSQCASRCTGVKNKFNFLTGQSYIYNFDSTSKVRIIGSQVPENPLRQTATVTISVIQPCEFSLKLSNVQIQGHNDRSWQEELESRPLRFSFDDGIIGEICPHSQEPAWALNIKRAILSTFQNALEGSTRNREVYETDVSGKCPAKYEISKDRRSEKTILKKKDLIRCLNHRGNYTGIKGVQYNIKSKLQNAPLIDSNQECKHVISRRILKEAICTETHSFQPFRNQKGENSAIVAEVSQKLQFVNNRKDTVQTSVGPKKSLTFDHSEFEFEESAQSKSQVVNNIRELCRISSSDVRPETPGLFTELVYGLRKLGFSELRSVYQDVQKNRICAQDKKLFLDAIPACGSESCVKLMVTILKAGSLSSSETVQWVTSLVFIPKPTLNMVKDVSQLVGTIQPKALLGLSSLVHGYCRVNPSCAEVPEVRQIMTQLRNKLGNKCSKIRNQESTGIFVLKAIGNIGHVESAVPVLINCLDSRNSIEIRLEAIQALRRMPCGVGQQKDTLMQLFRDNSEDIEIRLVSFMTLMKCPTAELISEVKNVLDSETITQVGSFVWSYLKEKSSSSDPFQRKLYQMLHQHSFSSKFNRDPRKFSRFYEFGKFIEQLNMGAHADSAVIMEPHGYLPRQGFFNFTVHLFGSSINLFEIGGRTEGLERLKEKLFGPDGYFSNPAGYYFGETDRKDHSSSRVKSFQDLFSRRRTFSDEFSMSMYLKIFGDDLMYYDFKNANMLDEIKNMANTEKLIQYLAEQRNFKISKNMLFLDSTLTIPTISGLPLRLAVNGTASVNLEYGGKMDFTQLAQPPHNRIEILGEIKPSAAIELSSSLALHVRDMKTGMKMVGRLHTSTAAKGSISLRDGEFKAKLELPDDQMEIIDIQSEVLHIVGNRHIIEPGTRGQKFQAQSCSSSNFNRISGLKICGMLTYNKGVSRVPYFPLSGPMRTKITVEKSDPSLRSYELTTKFRNTQAESLLEFGVDTPGSTVDREVKAKIQYKPGSSSAPTSVKVNLKAPEKEYNIEGELTRNNNIDEGQLSLTVDNRNRYAVSAKLQKTVQRGRRVHNLEAEVAIPGQEAVKLTGNLQSQSKRYSIDFNLEGVYSQPIEGRAKWEQPETQNKKFNSELMFKCPALHFDLKAFGEADPSGSLQYQYTMEYKRPRIDRTPHKITASQKQVIQRRGDTIKLISTSTFDSSWYPDWNSVTKYTMVKSSDLFENRLNIQYGATKKTADFVQATRITEGDKYTTNLDLKIPESRLNEKMKIIYQNRFPDSFLAKLLWPTFKDFKGELRLENSNNRLWQFEAEAKAKYTGREVRLYKEIKELSPQTYQSEAILQWQRNKQIEINTNLKIKSARGSYGYEMSGDAKMSGQPDVIRFSKRFQMSRDETKYMAWTKVGDRSLYDLKLDTIKESQTKTNFHAHLKSQYLDNTDYAVSGYVDDSAGTTKYVATVKKAQRDWMKGEVILPKKVANSPEVRAKGHLFWDMHTRDVKEIMADYKLTKDGRERQHDLQTKIKSGRADYLWNVKIVKGDYYVMNSTIIKNNKPIMETNWGSKVVGEIINPSELAIDFKFRTHPPMRLHHVTGLLVYNNAGDEQMTASVFVQNHQNNKKAGIKMGTKFENVGRGTRGSYQLSLILNDKELSTSTVVNMPNSERFLVLNGNSKTKLAWAKNKEITLDEEFQLDISRTSFYKSTWKTPFRQLSELKSELRLETPTNPPKFSFLYEWNKNKRISGHLTGTVDESAVDLNLNLETSFRTLKKLEGKLKYNFRPQIWDIETWMKWNNQGRIKFIHQIRDQSGKYTVKLGAWCEIPGTVNLIANSDFEFDSSQRKYLADCSLNFDGQNYKLKADVNLDNKNGEIQIETPYENWRSASLEVSKSNNNQYLIETKRNGAKTGSVTALVKMETNDHQVKFEVDDVRHPFNLIYEGTYTRRKWNFRAEVNRNPNNPSTKQTYGIQLTDESKGESEAEGRMVIRHPSRQVELKISRDESVANTFKVTAEFQPNAASKRNPTKLEFVTEKRDGVDKAELTITDQSLPKEIKLTYRAKSEGQCTSDLTTSCNCWAELNFDYSRDPKKLLSIKTTYSFQPAARNSGRRISPEKMDADFQINHQATDLYLKLFASGNSPASLNSRTEKKWTAGVEYKNSRREVKQYVSNLEISRDMDSIMLQVITPEDNWAIRYTILSGQTHQIMVLRNAKPTYDVVVTYNPQERIVRFEIKKSSTSEVLFHASAQLTNSDTARVRIWHTEQGIRIDDGEFIVRLSRADLLNTKFYVRPGFTREIQHVSRQKMNQWKKTGGRSNALKKIGNAAVTAVSSTGVGLRNDIQTHTQPLFQYWNQETGQMVSDIGPGMEEVSDQILLYWEMSKELGLSFLDVAETSLDQVMDTVPGDNLKEYYNSMKETISSMPETLREMIEPLLEAWARLIQVYEEFSSKMSDGKQWISDKLNIEEARDKLCRAWEDVKNSDLVRQTNQWYEDTLRSVTGMSPRQVYRRYYKKVEDGVGRMSALGGQLWDEWEDWILEFEVGRDMADWVQEIGSKLKSNYISYVDPEDRFENIISWLRELISSYNPGTDAGWNRYLPNVKVNDPETGQYEVDIPLPMKVHSLEHLASHAHPKTLQAVANKIQSKFNPLFSKSQPETEQQTQTGSSEYSGGYSVWDTVYHYKPTSWKPHNWVPPYESTAYIIGNQHFVTFDGRVYDFMGNCEYLLARDFHDKKFTITVEFTLARGGRSAELKNLKVHSSGHLIELPRVGPVKVDGQEVELPWQKMDRMEGMVFVKVMEKKTAVVLKTSDNLKVKCRRNFFMCSITLPGHYHAKSAGLLGSNDNEPNNDMTTSDGTITNAVEDFAKSWHTGGRKCSSERNLAPSIRVQPGSTLYNVCKRKFLDNNSPFRACFGQINPSPYMSMCRVDMQTYGSTASCNISAAYIAACNRQGIELTMPVNCVKCSADLSPGEPASTFQDRQIAKSADVVFAVEERPSMKWTQGKIPDIARRLKGELRKKGLATIRYGVIGFSGEGVHYKPHFHTGGGQINMNLNGLQVAARNLAMDKTTMESFGSPVDPMKTLDFIADKYPFRPTVNKIVVLITSTECGSKSVGYYDLQTKVLELGIMLHMISEKEIELDSGSGSFIGLDAHSLFTSTGSNSELRENLVEPHDSCTILAQETNGTVFSGKNDNAQKHGAIVQRITSEIGNKLIPTTCQMCECQLSRCQTSPFKVCFPCEIPRPVSLTNSDKFFNIPYLKLKKTAQEALAQWVA